ncbi:MAG: lytic transglycosylase domain-containing protein [Terriglobia bacterium]
MKVDTLDPSTVSHVQQEFSAHHDSSFWSELISRVAETADINPRIAVLVASHESGLNPQALNQSSGAIGMMQLMPATAAGLGVNPHNVVENILGGVHYLRQQITTFGDTAKALAAYNWGPNHVSEAIKRWGDSWLDHAPTETQQYVNSIVSQAGVSTPVSPKPENAEIFSDAYGLSASALSPSTPVGVGSNSESLVLTAGRLRILQTVLDAYLLSGILS